MYKARRHLNKRSLRNLYCAYIYPYLTYCIEVWGCASKKSIIIVSCAKKILRIMTYSSYLAHTGPLFKGLKILPVNKLFIDRIGILMFKTTYEFNWNRVARVVGLLRKLKYTLPIQMLRSIYNSPILPHMHYVLLAWGTKCHKIELLQKKALIELYSLSRP